MLLSAAQAISEEQSTVTLWHAAEITLIAKRDHPRPFHEVDLSAVFTGPSGATITRPAFWDGDRTWKIRFAPTEIGTWTYATSASDPTDAGLHGQRGGLCCIDYTGDLPIYRRGFLRVSDDHRHLCYRDGAPFFWLADTHWLWEKEHLEEANAPGWTSQFRGMVERRVAQGFTVYQVELFGRWRRGGLGASTANSQSEPDIEHFRTNVDPKWQYLAERGLVTAATLGILNKDVTRAKGELEARMARYVCARYGAYPSVWLMYQECTANRKGQFAGEEDRLRYLDVVRGVGRAYQSADAYHQPRTAHSDAPLVTAFRGEDWLDFTLFQGGHGKEIAREPYYDFYFDPALTIPQIEGEANYEHLFEGSEPNSSRLITTDAMREKAYQAMQCGCAGYSYAANGVWQATWGDEHTGNQSTYGTTPWHQGIALPGGDQMKHLKNFYTKLPWQRLQPRPECDGFLSWDAKLTAPQRPAVSADATAACVVAYFFRGAPFPCSVRHLQHPRYAARWFNPRTGTCTGIGEEIEPQNGTWACPAKPDAEDWLLVLEAQKSAASAQPVPSRWLEILAQREAERSKNAALRARVTASSTDWTHSVYHPANAIDGNTTTTEWAHWSNDARTNPPSAEKPAWLLLEWDAPVEVAKVMLYTMHGYEVQDYSLEYRAGGAWKSLAEAAGNADTVREHVLPAPVLADGVRFVARKGSVRQPTLVRVVELEVIAAVCNPLPNS